MMSEAVLSVLALVAELIREFGSFLAIVAVTFAWPSRYREAAEPCPRSAFIEIPSKCLARGSRDLERSRDLILIVTVLGMRTSGLFSVRVWRDSEVFV